MTTLSADKQIVDAKTTNYNNLLQRIQNNSDSILLATQRRHAIPNLLNNIMSVIPKEVQVLSIINTTDKHIKIDAQSATYQSIGCFIAKIKSDNTILVNVTSTSGVKTGDMVTVTIEGDLPY